MRGVSFWGLIEVAIVVIVLNSITNNDTALIISALGLIYASMRLNSVHVGLVGMEVAGAYDLQLYEIKRLIHKLAKAQASVTDDQWFEELSQEKLVRPDPKAFLEKAAYPVAIVSYVPIGLIYLVCLYQFFVRVS